MDEITVLTVIQGLCTAKDEGMQVWRYVNGEVSGRDTGCVFRGLSAVENIAEERVVVKSCRRCCGQADGLQSRMPIQLRYTAQDDACKGFRVRRNIFSFSSSI